jgi:hypothetical protein
MGSKCRRRERSHITLFFKVFSFEDSEMDYGFSMSPKDTSHCLHFPDSTSQPIRSLVWCLNLHYYYYCLKEAPRLWSILFSHLDKLIPLSLINRQPLLKDLEMDVGGLG